MSISLAISISASFNLSVIYLHVYPSISLSLCYLCVCLSTHLCMYIYMSVYLIMSCLIIIAWINGSFALVPILRQEQHPRHPTCFTRSLYILTELLGKLYTYLYSDAPRGTHCRQHIHTSCRFLQLCLQTVSWGLFGFHSGEDWAQACLSSAFSSKSR